MSPTAGSLFELEILSDKLNTQTEELNSVIADLDKRLGAMRLGVTVWLVDDFINRTPVANQPNNIFVWEIGYAKVKEEWCIAARHSSGFWSEEFQHWDLNPVTEAVPLLKAPRIVRVEAAALLDKLINELKDRVTGYVASLENAKHLVAK